MTIITSFSIDYPFTEVEVSCPGMLADGVATLVHDCDGEFYVKSFTLTKGDTYERHGSGHLGSHASRWIFEQVAKSIQNDTHAQDYFGRALAEYCEPASLIAAE